MPLYGERDIKLGKNMLIRSPKNRKNKMKFKPLKKQLTTTLILGILISSFIATILFYSYEYIDDNYLLSNKISSNYSHHLFNEFDKFIKKDGISTNDYEQLQNWNKRSKNTISLLYIFKNDRMCYYSHYGISSYEKYDKKAIENLTDTSLDLVKKYNIQKETMRFSDGYADVYIEADISDYLKAIILVFIFIIWLSIILLIFTNRLKREINYINELSNQVDNMKSTDLDEEFTVIGNNEISNLAKTLNLMKNNIIEKEKTERELRQAQEKLVTGMAHDIRTPMTSILNYAEILRKTNNDTKLSPFIEKIIEKVNDLHTLSDQMFEYFFISGKNIPRNFEISLIEHSLGDYLSELYALLEYENFIVNADNLIFIDEKIKISSDFLARINNNIFSNIIKYADKSEPVYIYSKYEDMEYKVFISNTISNNVFKIKGSKIGVNNIKFMMQHMDGYCTDEQNLRNNKYTIMLAFKIQK